MRRWLVVLCLCGSLLLSLVSQGLAQAPQPASSNKTFELALIGDLPYDAEQEAQFRNLIADINQHNVAFTIHDGDFKSGNSVCSDKVFLQRQQEFQSFQAPFVLIPGDNEWTDCHRITNGSYNPLERLAKLREVFFTGPNSLGRQSLPLTRQSEQPQYRQYRENVRWTYGDIVFVGLNLPGSNNNLGRTPAADAEYRDRNAANLAWLQQGFALAQEQPYHGLMLIIHANPNFELPATDPNRSGYNDFLAALTTATLALDKPVVLVHGDSHNFQINKPLFNPQTQRRMQNFTRVETFGSPDVHWIKATVDPRSPQRFNFEIKLVEQNL